jgi:hypothetical protein
MQTANREAAMCASHYSCADSTLCTTRSRAHAANGFNDRARVLRHGVYDTHVTTARGDARSTFWHSTRVAVAVHDVVT